MKDAGHVFRRSPVGNLGRDVKAPAALGRAAERTIGKALDLMTGALESLVAPQLTPQQKIEGEIVQRERRAEAEDKAELSRFLRERAQASQRQEQEREATRQREREDRDR